MRFFTKRKAMAAVTSLSLIALIVSSTFAWTSLYSQKVNEWRGSGTSRGGGPGASMHDDHENNASKKDVYVENWGSEILYVRIKLSEYMEIGTNAGSVTQNQGILTRNAGNISIPLVDETVSENGVITWVPHIPEGAAAYCDFGFHDYWAWGMGGSKVYKPATEEQKQAGRVDKSIVLTDLNDYNGLTDAQIEAQGLKRTLPCTVVTIDQYNALPESERKANYYWFIDNDGWAYWAGLLSPGYSTGLLLNKVSRTDLSIPDTYYYAINVQAQMADITSPFVTPQQAASLLMEEEEATAVTAASPDDFTTWIAGIVTEPASEDAIAIMKQLFLWGVEDGLFDDKIIVSDEIIDEIFTP